MSNSSALPYTISLDNPHETRQWNWIVNNNPETSNSNLLNDTKLHEFEIHAVEMPTEFTCYFCNIEVPYQYKKEHNESKKHKINSEIAKISLERTMKQQFYNVSHEILQFQNKNEYYCISCAVIVNNCDKEYHENSIEHKDSMLNDHLLGQMLKFYADKSVPLANDVTKILNKHKTLTANAVGTQIINTVEPKISLENYLYFLNTNCMSVHGRNKYVFYDANKVGVNLRCRYHPVVVPLQNFLGYSYKSSNDVQCLICNTSRVYVGEEIEMHSYTLQHVENLLKSEPDKDSIIKVTTNKNYCIVCNQIFYEKDTLSHLSSVDHDKKYFISNSHPDVVCKEMPLDNYLILISTLYQKEYVLRATYNEKVEIRFPNGVVLTVEEDNFHGFYGSMSYCCTCLEKSYIEDIRDYHKYTLKHIENIMVGINFDNSFRTAKNGKIFCIVCKSIVHTTCTLHELDPVHRQKFCLALGGNTKTLNINGFLLTEVSSSDDSVKTNTKRKSQINDSYTVDAYELPDDLNKVLSDTSNILVRKLSIKENEIKNELKRNEEIPKRAKSSHFKGTLQNQEKNILFKEINDENLQANASNQGDMLLHVIETATKRKIKEGHTYCKPCDREIQTHNMFSHLKGTLHKKNEILCKKSNNNVSFIVPSTLNVGTNKEASVAYITKRKIKEGHTYCEPCDRDIQTHNMSSHLKGALHKQNTKYKIFNKITSHESDIWNDTYGTANATGSIEHPKNVSVLDETDNVIAECKNMFQIAATKYTNFVGCKTCKVDIPNHPRSIDEHCKGFIHNKSYSKLLEDNKLNIANGKIHCKSCDMIISERFLFDHITLRSHGERLKK